MSDHAGRAPSRRPIGRIAMLVVVMVLVATGAAQADGRAALRRQRAEMRQRADAHRRARAAEAAAVIGSLVDLAEDQPTPAAREVLTGLVAGLYRMGGDRALPLMRRVEALAASKRADAAARAAWDMAITAAREQLTDKPMQLLDRASHMGVIDIARRLLDEVVGFDPDNARVRRALGQVRVERAAVEPMRVPGAGSDGGYDTGGDEDARLRARLEAVDPNAAWFSPFEARMIRRGVVWDANLGWVYPGHRERYERGYVYDFDRRRWTTLDQANAYHSDRARAWRIRTAHLEVRGTADIQVLAQVATRLEAFYGHIFGVYANFFAGSRRVDPLRLAMGLAEHRPLEVHVYRTREQYLRASDAPRWSGGVYVGSEEASYFYGGPSSTMYHEFTHQVLSVFTGGNEAPAWLTEGIAVYTQTPVFGPGGLTFRGRAYSTQMSLDDLLVLRSGGAWDRSARHNERGSGPQYAAAGSLVTFCMHGGDGRYRDDFIDFLRDSYRGENRGDELWDYMGLSRRAFEARYRAWGAGR